jgi:hypothetical protein
VIVSNVFKAPAFLLQMITSGQMWNFTLVALSRCPTKFGFWSALNFIFSE